MFACELETELTLTIDGEEISVPAGQIAHFELSLSLWGAEASFVFKILDDTDVGGTTEDTLFELFIASHLIEVSFTAIPRLTAADELDPNTTIAVKGVVSRRALNEEFRAELGTYRRYEIDVCDPAALLLKQHRPCSLYVDATMQDVLDEHLAALTLETDWDVLDTTHPVLFVGLGADRWPISFYDLLMDFASRNDGHWLFDAAESAYTLCGEKPGDGEAGRIGVDQVAATRFLLPEPPRHTIHILNSNSEDIQDLEITNDDAADGIRQDVLMWTAVAADVTARKDLEEIRLRAPGPELEVSFSDWPRVGVQPGALVTLKDGKWPEDGFQTEETWRVVRLTLRGTATEDEPDRQWGAEEAGFQCEMEAWLEGEDEATPRLPAHRTPRYPARVEGIVVSEQGEEDDETWQVYTNDDTSVDQYKIKIPLWEDKEVVADLHPDLTSGHFYFPAYKGERVWVDLWSDRAQIVRFLDWRVGVRQPQDSQGNALFMGKSETNRTVVLHNYDDDKPVLTIERRLESDVGLIKLEEGTLTIRVAEEEGS